MRILFTTVLIGLLALAGASPAAAQSKPATDQGTAVGLSTTHDGTAERSTYTQQAQDEVRNWERKLRDFEAKANARATKAETSASRDLDRAWTETKAASGRLETASENGWDSAKASFKTASNKLAVAWHNVNPTDK
jgi:hypothetical protein